MFTQTQIHPHHRLESLISNLPELGRRDGIEPDRSTLGLRYHIYQIASGVRLPGSDIGCLQSALHRMGIGTKPAIKSGSGSVENCAIVTISRIGPCASL